MQVAKEDPEIYRATDLFMEAVDWIVYWLTGNLKRTGGILGVNAFWIKGRGYPDRSFLKALDPMMEDLVETKFAGEIIDVGDFAGHLSSRAAERLRNIRRYLPGTVTEPWRAAEPESPEAEA